MGLFSGLLDLGGLALGADSDSWARRQARKDRKESRRQFDAQMDTSIQRRVADARKAGIHPLFALGASVGASPTSHVGGTPTRGSAAGTALARISERISNAEIRKSEAEAYLANAQAKKIEQETISRGHDGMAVKTFAYGTNPGPDIRYGPAEFYNPQIPVSKSPGVVAGTLPGTVDVVFPDGRRIRTYSSELEADEIKQIDILYQRAVHKGADGFMAARKWLEKKGLLKPPGGRKPARYREGINAGKIERR